MPSITMRQLEYFVATAQAGTVTRAAERLHLSQSAVSTALLDFEHALGTQLFVRHARGLTLTATGHRILAESQRLLNEIEGLSDIAQELDRELAGVLRVGCYPSLAPQVVPALVDVFATRYPQVELTVIEGSRSELITWLRHGECDVALLYGYDLPADPEALPSAPTVLASAPPYLLLPADHELAERESITLAEIAGQPLILFDVPPSGRYFRSLFERVGLEPSVRFTTGDFEVVRSLVARGVGYSVLNQRTSCDLSYESRRVVPREIADPLPALDIIALAPEGVRLTRRARSFVGHARRHLSGLYPVP